MNLNSLPYGSSIIIEHNKPCTTRYNNLELILISNKVEVYSSIKQYVYKTKPHKRTLKIENYYELINVPELLFITNTYKTHINNFSINRVCKIIDNKLFTFSFLNIDEVNGNICWGDIPEPLINSLNDMNNMISLFWQSQFNYDIDSIINFEKYHQIETKTILIQKIIDEN